MAEAQDRMPAGARAACGALLTAVGLLAIDYGLRPRWATSLPHDVWTWLYNAIEFGAVLLCATRVLLRRHDRGAWLAVALGMALFAAGDVYYTLRFEDLAKVPFPSIDDALYLSFYPATYVGIVLLVRVRTERLPAGLWLDGVIGALAVAAVGAAVLFATIVSDTHGPALTVATNLAYPLADLLLLGILVGVAAVTTQRGLADWLLIALGFAVFAVTDSVYLVQTASGSYSTGGLLNVGWPAAMVIIAAAAWRMPRTVRRAKIVGWATFTLPALAGLTCVGVEFYDHFHRVPLVAHVLATACLLLVVIRLGLSFAQNMRMLRVSQDEALTDALTGLPNRRALKLELEARLAERPIDPFVLAFYDLDGFKGYNDTFGHQAGDALLSRLGARALAAVPAATLFRMGGDEFCVIAPEAAGGGVCAAQAARALSEHGSGFSVGCSFGTVSIPDEADEADAAMLLADTRMYDQKGERRPSAAAESQDVLVRALAERSRDLGQHNDDVAGLVAAVALEMGLTANAIVAIQRAAELHDVGKLAIPDEILHKPGALSDEEWDFMRRHTIIGARIVAAATSLRDVAPIVRSTHERWDGDGYPDGLAGEQIPLGARIIAVCDAYDAMTTDRSYRAAMPVADALAELRRCAGHQFDADVVEAFMRVRACGTADDAQAVAA